MSGLRLEIDPLRLDQELIGQASQYYLWSTKTADAQMKYDGAKSALSLLASSLSLEVRKYPEFFKLSGKPTNDLVDAVVFTQPEYVAAQHAVDKARHDLGLYKSAVDALEHRKRALTLMVDLWTREYYIDSQRRDRTGVQQVAEETDEDPYKHPARKARRMIRELEDGDADDE